MGVNLKSGQFVNTVKSLKAELKDRNAAWKAELKNLKASIGDLFTEIKAAGKLPQGAKKGYYCSEGLTQKDAQFANA